MADEADIETIRAQLVLAETRAASARARLQKWRDQYQAADGAQRRGVCNAQMGRAAAQLAQTERVARGLRMKLRTAEADLRHVDNATTAPTPPGEGWKLVVDRTLNIDGKAYTRGAEIDPVALVGCLNGAYLLAHYCRWVPRDTKVVEPVAAVPKPPVPAAAPVDHISVCRAELRRIADARQIDVRTALDLLPADMFMQAQKQYADHPPGGYVMTGAWGSPAAKQLSGVGVHGRRCIDGFIEYLITGERKEAA